MAFIKIKHLNIFPSPSPDVAGYYVYLASESEPLSYDTTKFDVGMQTEEIDLYELFGSLEGKFSVGAAPYDAAGNIADIVEIVHNYPFDSSPPEPVAGGEIY